MPVGQAGKERSRVTAASKFSCGAAGKGGLAEQVTGSGRVMGVTAHREGWSTAKPSAGVGGGD